MPALNAHTRFLLRGSALVGGLLVLWWFVLLGPLLHLLRQSANMCGSLFFGGPGRFITEGSSVWTFDVPLDAVIPASPEHPAPVSVHSVDFDLARPDAGKFTFGLPVYWAIVLAAGEVRRTLRPLLLGTVAMWLAEVAMLLLYAELYAHRAAASWAPSPGQVVPWLYLLLVCASPSYAVHWISSQTGPSTWTYTLQVDPLDNLNVTQSSTTITMTGLSGVTSATGPTSSDFPNPIGTNLLAWTPQVLNGGTKVVWTINGGGTGNFPTAKHIFGFSITAAGALNNNVSYATNGFQVDSNGPFRDISGTVAGPSASAPAPAGAPAATTFTLTLMFIGLALAGSYAVKNRMGQASE